MRRAGIRAILALAAAAAVLGLWLVQRDAAQPIRERASYPVARALGTTDTGGFARALAPREFEFPADHGPHPDFRTEWWYFTGNLRDPAGARFGFQLTFFRIALRADALASASRWRTRDLYMAHLAVTDAERGRFHAFERFSRGAAGLAGARSAPLAVWLEDWEAAATGTAPFPLRLRAHQGEVGLDLVLQPRKPVVLNGEAGLSAKSREPGNASYYYSIPRLAAHGRIQVPGATHEVGGEAWLDREWSTSALAPDQVGWDWFALQLDDGRELMYYRLRRRDGSADPASAGTLIGADGRTRHLRSGELELRALEHWRSPASGVEYPVRWAITVPGAGLHLETRALLAHQELDLTVRYWEGAVEVSGRGAQGPLHGHGYVELAGYGDRALRPAAQATSR